MKIIDLLNSGRGTLSCELFPPKAHQPLADALPIVRETARLRPAFISVTNGAAGSTGGHTLEVAQAALEEGVPALAHLVCMGAARSAIDQTLDQLQAAGIQNVLALRGDVPPEGPSGQFAHASQLTAHILSRGDFCVGGACYPEGHPESPCMDKDLDYLRHKVDSGCAFLTTQMFFDNNILYNFMFRLLKKGVDVPVVAGIMPVTNARQIGRIVKLSGTSLPARFRAIVDRFQDNPAAMAQAGIAYATDQIIDLVANGVSHIHLYTMNKPRIAGSIMANLSEIFPCA